MPGMENPDWLAYNLGSAEYGRIRQYGRTWQNATMLQNLAECGNVLLGAGASLGDIWPL